MTPEQLAREVVVANPGPEAWTDLDPGTRRRIERAAEVAGTTPATVWAASRAAASAAAGAHDWADRIAEEARS